MFESRNFIIKKKNGSSGLKRILYKNLKPNLKKRVENGWVQKVNRRDKT